MSTSILRAFSTKKLLVVSSQVEGLCTSTCELEIPVRPFLQPVKVPLDSIMTLWCINIIMVLILKHKINIYADFILFKNSLFYSKIVVSQLSYKWTFKNHINKDLQNYCKGLRGQSILLFITLQAIIKMKN